MSGLFVPISDSGGNIVHGLDLLHDSDRDPSREVRDEGGSIFDFIVLSANDIEFELIDIFLELFSTSNAGGGKPVHGFLLDVGIPKGFLKVCFKNSESLEGLVGKSLLVANFGPRGSRPFLHIRQGIGNLPVVVVVEGMVDEEIEVDGVQPGLGCFSLSIIFIRTSDANFGDPQTRGSGGGNGSRGGRGSTRSGRSLVRHDDHDW